MHERRITAVHHLAAPKFQIWKKHPFIPLMLLYFLVKEGIYGLWSRTSGAKQIKQLILVFYAYPYTLANWTRHPF